MKFETVEKADMLIHIVYKGDKREVQAVVRDNEGCCPTNTPDKPYWSEDDYPTPGAQCPGCGQFGGGWTLSEVHTVSEDVDLDILAYELSDEIDKAYAEEEVSIKEQLEKDAQKAAKALSFIRAEVGKRYDVQHVERWEPVEEVLRSMEVLSGSDEYEGIYVEHDGNTVTAWKFCNSPRLVGETTAVSVEVPTWDATNTPTEFQRYLLDEVLHSIQFYEDVDDDEEDEA